MSNTVKVLLRILPVAIGAIVAFWLVSRVLPAQGQVDLPGLANVGIALGMGAVVALVLRLALGSLEDGQAPARTTASEQTLRDRIAPLIIGIGTAGIVSIAVVVMLLLNFATAEAIKGKLDTIMLSVFSTVVPVFATWVGTVIAFYFTNESFRQAAESTRSLMPAVEDEAITAPNRMIPFDKITKIVLGSAELTAPPEGTLATSPDGVAMADVRKRFGDTVSRVIVFSAEMKPLCIIRKKLDTVPTITLVGEYLKQDGNAADAANFRFLPAQATVEDGRRALRLYNTADIFVTDRGFPDEPVKGWVPDDRLA